MNADKNDPLTTLKVHRSTLFRIQELRGKYGFTSGEKMLVVAMNLLEKKGGNGNGAKE